MANSEVIEPCEYLDYPSEAYIIDEQGQRRVSSQEGPKLCSWAHDAPEGVRLVDMPVWIQRLAMSGAYMNEKDCANCKAYRPRRAK